MLQFTFTLSTVQKKKIYNNLTIDHITISLSQKSFQFKIWSSACTRLHSERKIVSFIVSWVRKEDIELTWDRRDTQFLVYFYYFSLSLESWLFNLERYHFSTTEKSQSFSMIKMINKIRKKRTKWPKVSLSTTCIFCLLIHCTWIYQK